MGYGNFPWVITENQSQIPVWESQVKEKISSKSTSAEGTSAFWAYFLLSQVTLREEFGSDFLWSRMGNFHTPRVIRWGIAFLYYKRNRAWTQDQIFFSNFFLIFFKFSKKFNFSKFFIFLVVLKIFKNFSKIFRKFSKNFWKFSNSKKNVAFI